MIASAALVAVLALTAQNRSTQTPPSFTASNFVPLPLERIQQEPPLDGRRPVQAQLSPGGRYVTFLKPSVDDSEVLDLWAKPLSGGDGKEVLLVATRDLLGGKEQKLSEAEKMALERKRISKRGITGYDWCGVDDSALLFPLSGDLYVARLTDKGPVTTRLTTDDDVPEQNPACNKDGSVVAYVKGGNVVVHDIKSNKAKAVTKGASDVVSFGLAEFIADEELDRHEGFWWSPDKATLLVLKVDESPVGIKTRAQIFADKTEMVSQRYPAAGEKNAIVTAFVVDTKTGKSLPVALPKTEEYIVRGGFFDDGRPMLQTQNRAQTTLTLWSVAVDKKKHLGNASPVVVDVDDAWVETHDDLHELKSGLLWSSEGSGRRQLERLTTDSAGKLVRTTLTNQAEPVAGLVCASERDGVVRLVFTGAADRGKTQHLFVQEAGKEPRALTSGGTWNDAVADKGCARLLVTTSAWGVPPSSRIVDIDSGKVVVDVAGDPPDPLLQRASRNPARFIDVTAADGKTPLNGLYLPPSTTVARGSVPVIVHAYGGPTGQVVAHRWARNFPLFVHWQQQGFGVFLVDTRGMAHRDRAFTRAHKNNFGVVEIDDVKAAATQLPQLVKGVDPKRIGIFGWSYGGTLATRAVLDDKSPFAAAAAVAPVTDWSLYDTAYTERYIGVPTEADGAPSTTYAVANLVPRAKLLQRPLLLVHGTADDNVLFEHSLRLIQALEDEGVVFDTAIYPGKAHGIAGKKAQLHLHRTLTRFFVEHLRP